MTNLKRHVRVQEGGTKKASGLTNVKLLRQFDFIL